MNSAGFTNDYSRAVPAQTVEEPDECDGGPDVSTTGPTAPPIITRPIAPPNIILQIDNTSHYA